MKKKSVLPLSLRQLGNRSGDSWQWRGTLTTVNPIGTEDLAVRAGSSVEVSALCVAIDEGVSVTLTGEALLEGTCVRCLKPISKTSDFSRTEIYYYSDQLRKLIAETPEDQLPDWDENYQLFSTSELDLEPLLIDAIVPKIALNVLCDPNCQGLCVDCGVVLAEAEPDHHHEQIDPRWNALADFFGKE